MHEYKIQSIILNNKKFSLEQAVNFVAKNNFKHNKVDKTLNYWRFRQLDPSKLRKEGFSHYRNKEISDGINLVLAYKA
jgi:hypothetical protein